MDAITCMKTRRSIRKYQEKKIEEETLRAIVEVANCSPSWKNTQIARYIAVTSKEGIKKLMDSTNEHNQAAISQAAVVMIITVVKNRCGYERDGSFSTEKKDGWQMFDAGVASQTLCLAAHEFGIGTVIQGIFDYDKVKKDFNVGDDQEVIALIPMGYPAEEPAMPKRKSVEDLLTIV